MVKKIGILTLPPIYNYGNILQIYALQYVINDMGYEAVLINRNPQRNRLSYIKNRISVFVADLIRNINLDVNMDFMSVSSYGNAMESSGSVKILKDLDVDIKGKNVLIVEDIIDSGLTLSNLTKELGAREPKSLKICTLLDKPERRKADIPVDYVGFVIEDKFIVGYGIDYAEKYRNLPYIGIVEDV